MQWDKTLYLSSSCLLIHIIPQIGTFGYISFTPTVVYYDDIYSRTMYNMSFKHTIISATARLCRRRAEFQIWPADAREMPSVLHRGEGQTLFAYPPFCESLGKTSMTY
jgi:hypothetical protein